MKEGLFVTDSQIVTHWAYIRANQKKIQVPVTFNAGVAIISPGLQTGEDLLGRGELRVNPDNTDVGVHPPDQWEGSIRSIDQ